MRLVTFTHYRPLKKQGLENCTTIFDLQTSLTKFTRVVGFDKNSHAQALHFQVTKSPAKIVNINEKKIQSLSTKQAQLSKLAAVMSTFCAQLHRQSKGKRRKQSPVRQI